MSSSLRSGAESCIAHRQGRPPGGLVNRAGEEAAERSEAESAAQPLTVS
ncbi:MAG: hypothetical protein QGG74_03625 [Phycisphaerales bacterium]|nr:hypothetical protein [Phycisphaerales bacterium]